MSPPLAGVRARELFAIARRPPRVRVHDVESRVGQRRHLGPGSGAERRVWAAMHVEDKRRNRRATAGAEQPQIERVAFGMVDPDSLDRLAEGPEPAAAVRGELPQAPVLHRVDLRRPAARGGDCYATLSARDGYAYGIRLRQRGHLAVRSKAVWMGRARVRYEAQHVHLVERDQGRQSEALPVHVIAVAAVLERDVSLLRYLARATT